MKTILANLSKMYKYLQKQTISCLRLDGGYIVDEKKRRVPLMADAIKEYCDPNQGDYLPGDPECKKCHMAVICAHNAVQLGRIVLNNDELDEIEKGLEELRLREIIENKLNPTLAVAKEEVKALDSVAKKGGKKKKIVFKKKKKGK